MYFPVTSSGLRSASANIVSHEAKVAGLILLPAAAAATITLYDDSATAAVAGQELIKLQAVANGEAVTISLDNPLHANKGINAVVSGAGANYIVLYTH